MTTDNANYLESRHREKMVEYMFHAELLQEAWLNRDHGTIDVLRPDVDRMGYDLVLEYKNVVRYVQLKSSRHDATTKVQTVNARLAEKRGGCIVWIFYCEIEVDGNVRIQLNYRFFGGNPLETPALGDNVGKHTRANSKGQKGLRLNTRRIDKSAFTQLTEIHQLFDTPVPTVYSLKNDLIPIRALLPVTGQTNMSRLNWRSHEYIMSECPIQEAKIKFSALGNAAMTDKPQRVIRSGNPAVVVLAVEEHDRLRRLEASGVPTLGELLLN